MAELNQVHSVFGNKVRVRVCGICLQDNKVLVVKHKPITSAKPVLSPPGGSPEFGEGIYDCLKREFKEETGLDVKSGRFLYLYEFIDSPMHAVELFFEVHQTGGELTLGKDPELPDDQQLIEEVKFMSLAEIRAAKECQLHGVFQELVNLDDLLMPRDFVLKPLKF